MTSPYPGYYQASDGQWYPVPATAAAPPPPAAPALPPGYGPPPPAAGYAAPPAPPEPVGARGTLEDMVDQPSAGGGTAHSKFFTPARMQGHWLRLRVSRDLNANDVQQQRDKNNRLLTFQSTGKPKFQLLVPCQVLESSDPGGQATIFDDGRATVYLKGVPFDSFKEAMAASGVSDPAKAVALGQLGGAEFYMVGNGTKQFGTGNPANMFNFTYTPNGRELNGTTSVVTGGPVTVADGTVVGQIPPTPGPAVSAPPPTAPAPPAAPPAPPAPPASPAPPAPPAAPPPPSQATPPPPPGAPAPGVPAAPPPPPAAAPAPPAPPAPPTGAATPPAPPATADPYPGYYQASDGQWYPNQPAAAPTAPGQAADPKMAALLAKLSGGQQ